MSSLKDIADQLHQEKKIEGVNPEEKSTEYEGILETDENNTDERLACVLILDCSTSMNDENRITQLNEGLEVLKQEMLSDPKIKRMVRTMVLRAGTDDGKDGQTVKLLQPFCDVVDLNIPKQDACGMTPLGQAVKIGLEALQKEKAYIEDDIGATNKRPWMFIITDGNANDPQNVWDEAVRLSQEARTNNKVSMFGLRLDADCNQQTLEELIGSGNSHIMNASKLKEFFVILSASSASDNPMETLKEELRQMQ